MGMPKWLKAVVTIAGAVVPGVAQVEAIAKAIPTLKGKQKQDAVVELVKTGLQSAEELSGHDLANDAEVIDATRAVIDAEVALMKAKDALAAVIKKNHGDS